MQVPPVDKLMPVYVAAAETVDRYLDPVLCRNPLPLLAGTIGVLTTSESSPFLPDAAKTKVTDAIKFLGERLAALVSLVDPSAPAINTAHILPTGT